MRAMLRYEVPVDDRPHLFTLTGDPVAVAPRWADTGGDLVTVVEFWAEHDESKPAVPRTFVIVGTGNRIPPGATHVGTAPRTREGLVWHLYELDAAVAR